MGRLLKGLETTDRLLNNCCTAARRLLYSCWEAAERLLGGWKYSSLNQGNPKSMKHEKRQRYVRISETSGLKDYKQTHQPFTTT